jgi:hypothetical protein
MENRCSECGGRLVSQVNGVFVCEKCGVEDDSFPIDLSPAQIPLHKLKYRKIPKKRWSPDSYSRNVKQLNRLARRELPRAFAENIISLVKDTISLNYKNNVPKTRDKKAILWTIFISWIEYSIKFFEKSNQKDEREIILACKSILNKLNSENHNRFLKTQKLIEQVKRLIFLGIKEVDNSYRYVNVDGLFNLLYETAPSISDENRQKNVQEVSNAGMFTANLFLKNEVNKQIANKSKRIKAICKRNGLFGASCYLACQISGLEMKEQKDWADYFHISESSFDKLLKTLRGTIVVPSPEISNQA